MRSTPTLRIHVDAKKVKSAVQPKNKEIERANRLVVNKLTTSIKNSLGRELPVKSGIRIAGFKRVRTYKQLARAISTSVVGKVWIGGNPVAARYAGKPRDVKGGARAGKHFFKDAFVATMGNGYTSIFKRALSKTRSGKNKLVDQTVPIVDLNLTAERTLNDFRGTTEAHLNAEITKILRKRVR